MLPPMIFTNGRLIFPERCADGLSLRVTDGKIAEIGPEIRAEGEEVIDLAGNYLSPGFIDLHVHGAVGRDTMEGTAEGVRENCVYPGRGRPTRPPPPRGTARPGCWVARRTRTGRPGPGGRSSCRLRPGIEPV